MIAATLLGRVGAAGRAREANNTRRALGLAMMLASALAMAAALNRALGKPVLVLRWSALRFLLSRSWTVGDGREQALAD